MSVPEIGIEPGVCIGFGGSNARFASCDSGDIIGFRSIETPNSPDLFFKWMARKLVDAADDGYTWMVAGYPGLVSRDGEWVGPMQNVQGMNQNKFNLIDELEAVDRVVGQTFEEGFTLVAVNDGTLQAHAAAEHYGANRYDRVAALIVGTGVGAGVVDRDPRYANVYRADTGNAYEIGHIPMLGGNVADTYESLFRGPAIQQRYGQSPEHLPADHYAWEELSGAMLSMIGVLGCISSANLVVITSGVGSGASEKYMPYLNDMLLSVDTNGNAPQKELFPAVLAVPSEECQTSELYGAEGVMRAHRTAA